MVLQKVSDDAQKLFLRVFPDFLLELQASDKERNAVYNALGVLWPVKLTLANEIVSRSWTGVPNVNNVELAVRFYILALTQPHLGARNPADFPAAIVKAVPSTGPLPPQKGNVFLLPSGSNKDSISKFATCDPAFGPGRINRCFALSDIDWALGSVLGLRVGERRLSGHNLDNQFLGQHGLDWVERAYWWLEGDKDPEKMLPLYPGSTLVQRSIMARPVGLGYPVWGVFPAPGTLALPTSVPSTALPPSSPTVPVGIPHGLQRNACWLISLVNAYARVSPIRGLLCGNGMASKLKDDVVGPMCALVDAVVDDIDKDYYKIATLFQLLLRRMRLVTSPEKDARGLVGGIAQDASEWFEGMLEKVVATDSSIQDAFFRDIIGLPFWSVTGTGTGAKVDIASLVDWEVRLSLDAEQLKRDIGWPTPPSPAITVRDWRHRVVGDNLSAADQRQQRADKLKLLTQLTKDAIGQIRAKNNLETSFVSAVQKLTDPNLTSLTGDLSGAFDNMKSQKVFIFRFSSDFAIDGNGGGVGQRLRWADVDPDLLRALWGNLEPPLELPVRTLDVSQSFPLRLKSVLVWRKNHWAAAEVVGSGGVGLGTRVRFFDDVTAPNGWESEDKTLAEVVTKYALGSAVYEVMMIMKP